MGLTLLAGVAGATTVDCGTLTTLNLLITGTSGGNFCQIGDVIISGTTFSQSAGTAVTTSGVVVSINDNPDTNTTGAERGLNFNGQGAFATGVVFTITFNGQLCLAGNPNCNTGGTDFIASAPTLLTEGQVEQTVPVGSAVTTTNSIKPGAQPSIPLPAGPGNNANPQTTFAGTTTFSFSLGDNGQGALNTIEGDVQETVGPEPSTMLLMGGALIALGVTSRKMRRKV